MNCVAILVTYNPNIERLSNLLNSLFVQADFICIVDNNSNNLSDISDLAYMHKYVKIINNSNNVGIAGAQNLGIEFVSKLKPSFVIFFDQDSQISDNFICHLINKYQQLESENLNPGLVSPIMYNDIYEYYYPIFNLDKSGVLNRKIPDINAAFIESNIVASSGSLISFKTLKHVGGMCEELFIDFVDTEFSLRLSSYGYNSYLVTDLVMNHTIGESFIKFIKYKISVHKPFRRYYVTRNCLILRKYPHIHKKYFLHMFFRTLVINMIIIACCRNKMEYIKYIIKGYRDGFSFK
jgi:rhamnosyltransferase